MGPSPATVGDAMPTPCVGRRACDALDEDDDGEDDLFPPIGLKWGFCQTLIPVIDAEGNPVDTIDPEAVHGSLFFKLESKTQWVFSCIKNIPRYAHAADKIKWKGPSGASPVVRSITQLPTYQKLVDKVNGCFGKRKKTVSKVDIDGKDTADYVQRVEPSVQGGRKIARAFLDELFPPSEDASRL